LAEGFMLEGRQAASRALVHRADVEHLRARAGAAAASGGARDGLRAGWV